MPKFVSKPHTDNPWSIKVRCAACKYVYQYFADDVVKGEDYFDQQRPAVYCGNCRHTNLLPINVVPKKVVANARQY